MSKNGNERFPFGENWSGFLRILSEFWKIVKRLYCSGWLGRTLLSAFFYPVFFLPGLLIDNIRLRNPAVRYHEHKKYRGMSLVHDWRDWLGETHSNRLSWSVLSVFMKTWGLNWNSSCPPGTDLAAIGSFFAG